MEQMIKLWNKNKVKTFSCEFDCGGDSMGNTHWGWEVEEGFTPDEGEMETLEMYFNEQMYRSVDFYVNSDGHYCGEFGEVHVKLETEDYEEPTFTYTKDAKSEYNETFNSQIEVSVRPELKAFLEEYVASAVNSEDEGFQIIYKKDIILTEEKKKLVEEFKALLVDTYNAWDVLKDAKKEYAAEDLGDFHNCAAVTTDEGRWGISNENELLWKDGNLVITLECSLYVYKPSDD